MPAELGKFIDEVLKDPEARATFEEAQYRHAIVDALVRRRKTMGITAGRTRGHAEHLAVHGRRFRV